MFCAAREAVMRIFSLFVFTDGADDAVAAEARRYVNRRKKRKILNLESALYLSNYKKAIPSNAGVHTR